MFFIQPIYLLAWRALIGGGVGVFILGHVGKCGLSCPEEIQEHVLSDEDWHLEMGWFISGFLHCPRHLKLYWLLRCSYNWDSEWFNQELLLWNVSNYVNSHTSPSITSYNCICKLISPKLCPWPGEQNPKSRMFFLLPASTLTYLRTTFTEALSACTESWLPRRTLLLLFYSSYDRDVKGCLRFPGS